MRLSIVLCVLVYISAETGASKQTSCFLPADPGDCDGACPKWYYDAVSGQCKQFTYGCCGGNENNFPTKKKCKRACKGADICLLPKDIGPCEGLCQRYFYNKITQECEKFSWGCCEGNANNFPDFEACKKRCDKPIEKPHCYLPADVGPCDASCPRWFYDPKDRECKKFDWGCCGGNKNNFKTKKQCKRSCKGADICKLPKDVGPCDGSCPRWFYNRHVHKCLPFEWGCCPGNANNFETEMMCNDQCG